MSPTKPPADERLRHVANNLLNHAPAGSLSLPIVESLQAPTLGALHRAGAALLSGGHLDSAEALFRALSDWPGIDPWVASGLAQVASARCNWDDAVSAWQACFNRFSDRVEPWWFVELAKAERERGQHAEAEAHLRQCRAKFPAFGPAAAALADILGTLGRHEECFAAWQSVFREFSATVQPWWFVALAKVERQHGQHAEAEKHLRQCRAKFPVYEPAAVALAELFGSLGRIEDCLAAWQTAIREFSATAQPWWFVELVRAERERGQLTEAEAHLRECRAKFPAYGPAAVALADLLGTLGRQEECLAAWHSLIHEFPEIAEPWWFVELARAERQRGRHTEAEAQLRQCRAQFPEYGPAAAALADLLGTLGRHEECVAAWQAAIPEFSEIAEPWWFLGFAAAFRALGSGDQAERILDDRDARFPDIPETLMRQAEAAAHGENWAAALDLWTTCIERHRSETKPEWLNGQALALFRVWRVDEALDTWKYLIESSPEFISGRIYLAAAARELGLWSTMRQCFDDLIARFPDSVTPDWLAQQARALLYERSEQAASRVIAELNERFPDSPQGCYLSLEYSYAMHLGVNVILPQIEAAVRRFPNDHSLIAEQVRTLLASGRPEEADDVVSSLAALGNDHHALISRWLVVMDRNGEGALQESARNALTGRDWMPESGLAIADFLLSLLSPWAAELARELLDDVAAKFPGRAGIVSAQARALIMLRRDDQALQRIDSLHSLYQTSEILELGAWAAFRRGELARAQDIWRTILSRHYFPALHSAEPELELLTPERADLPPNGVTAFVNIRNEMAHLPEFLRHHRSIGVTRFVCVDNMSTDSSADYLRSQPDVILYQTRDAFQTSSAGMRWINVLQERHGEGEWCLYADADEALIYPGWETTPLSRLTAYLDHEGAEGVTAFMLDVYPQKLLDKAGKPATHAEYRYYDANYSWIGQVRAPYIQPTGGVRWRLFQVHEILHKVPLIRHGAGRRVNSHNTTPLRFAGISAVLVHYKLLNLALRFRPPSPGAGGNPFMANRTPDLMRRHVRYAARMANLMKTDLLRRDLSEALTDSLTLADRGLMRAPAEFRQWLQAGS